MQEQLLLDAIRHAYESAPAVRAAARLHIARVESVSHPDRARLTWLAAVTEIRQLAPDVRGELLDQAQLYAAAIDPGLIAQLQLVNNETPPSGLRSMRLAAHNAGNILSVMVANGHIDAAVDSLLSSSTSDTFPFHYVGNILHHTTGPEKRLQIVRAAVAAWRTSQSADFVRTFSHFWQMLPEDEARDLVRELVDRTIAEPDNTAFSARYPDEVVFTSSRENTFFHLLHALRVLDPTLAEWLIAAHSQLAAAAERFPEGLQTMREEAEAEQKRRAAEGQTCGGGYILSGSGARGLDEQRALLQATRDGNFAPCIEFALEHYREDTDPAKPNFAAKEFWYSTVAFRNLFYQAGKKLGTDAASLLDRVPDADLRLFAKIELAAALAALPQMPSISRRRGPRPKIRASHGGRILEPGDDRGEPMPGIHCPLCQWQPRTRDSWMCKCGHFWNTFTTRGVCPACNHQWKHTVCVACQKMPPHEDWYGEA
jgi:hypothetical protein